MTCNALHGGKAPVGTQSHQTQNKNLVFFVRGQGRANSALAKGVSVEKEVVGASCC